MGSGYYDVGLACLEGHGVNGNSRTRAVHNMPFCDRCGSKTIDSCPKCSKPIRGDYNVRGVGSFGTYYPPAFCHECGEALPWTEARLKAARDLIAEMDDLSAEEKARLSESVSEISKDTAQTSVAVVRIKKFAAKVGKGTWDIFTKILTDVASETAKKTLGLP